MLTRPKSILPFQIAREAVDFDSFFFALDSALGLRGTITAPVWPIGSEVFCFLWCISRRYGCEPLQRGRGFLDPAARRLFFFLLCDVFAP